MTRPPDVKPTVDRHLWEITAVQDLLWLLTLALSAWSVYALRGIFIPVFIALMLAYLANPLVQFAERRWSWPRPLTVSLFLLFFTALTAGTIAVIGPLVSEQIQTLVKNPAAANGAARLLFVAKHIERIGDYVKDICELNVYLTEAVFIKHSSH